MNLPKREEITVQASLTMKFSLRIQDAARQLKEQDAEEAVIVTEQEEYAGTIHKEDLYETIVEGISPDTQIGKICSAPAAELLLNEPLTKEDLRRSRLPVSDEKGRFIGFFSFEKWLQFIEECFAQQNDCFQAILQQLQEGILIIDKNNQPLFWNTVIEEWRAFGKSKTVHEIFTENEWHLLKRLEPKKEQSITLAAPDAAFHITKYEIIYKGNPALLFTFLKDQTSSAWQKTGQRAESLETIYEYLYDGIIMVDNDGYITMLSQEYADFLEVKLQDVIGRHVTEVIENTRMHIVVQTGKPEIADLQRIKGDYMIASRIPIIKNGEITGAVGKVLFKNVGGFNALYKRIHRMEKELKQYKGDWQEQHQAKYQFSHIIGESRTMKDTKQLAEKAADTDSNVLLLGESGTGKELFAHAIHNASSRAPGSFVKVNCAAIPPELLEAELFGYVEGSFTGAKKGGKKGKFEAADGGTIFLDEIGELPLHMQVKFLRVLQEKEVEKVGANNTTSVDVRIIAATNRDLEEMVDKGEFRLDLYYRLNVIAISIPPLRDREEDIKKLTTLLLNRISEQMGKHILGISDKAKFMLLQYHWPGNIRELENVLERAINLADPYSELQPEHFSEKLRYNSSENIKPLHSVLEEAEKLAISRALQKTEGNKSRAASLLGISRTAFYEKIKKYSLE
ncbi:sigma 54-interacting transcriptional regulator [Alteribacillus sp. JSM 102045]|uniref:sigma 54-interacting transcriptional regulator n=1 Tax=Alteribacillus sp. JSM 102045 TaxID=1562101 RepID=UPI0035C029E5